MCVGLNLLIGYAGQISLGHAGFFGMGAYGSALLTSGTAGRRCSRWPRRRAGVALLAFVVARPILSLKGHYLAMATLGLGIIVSIVIATEDRVDGRARRHAGACADVLGFEVVGERAWYWVVGGCLLLAIWLALNLIDSPAGRALRALHSSEVAARSGRRRLRSPTRSMVFVVSAAFASVCRQPDAPLCRASSRPATASFLHSIELVTMVVFGGMASIFGAVVGAAVLTVLPQVLTLLKDYEMVVFGALLMLTMIFLPRGVVPTLGS